MDSFLRRDLAILVLIAALVAGWSWDHLRTAGMLHRTAESEQYFRQRLFESLEREFQADLQELEGTPADLMRP